MDYFTINGVKSTDAGIICKRQPDIVLAAPRVTFQTIPGRDGSLVTAEEGPSGEAVYDDITLTCECYMRDLSRLSEAAAFLSGAGDIAFPVRPGGHYRGRAVNQIPIEQIVKGRTQRQFEVMFRVEPYWYRDNVQNITLTSAADVKNPGNAPSEPIITVNATGDGVVYVGDTVTYLTGLKVPVTLDCGLKIAYRGEKLMNAYVAMDGPWPRLNPGYNYISWTGSISGVVIEPRWRDR